MVGDHGGFAGELEEPGDFSRAENRGADGSVAVVAEEWLGTGHVEDGDRTIGMRCGFSERGVVFFF